MADALFIGLMSGTSLDGVDVALVAFTQDELDNDEHLPKVLHTHFLAYPQSLRKQILALQHPTENELETTALMANTLAKLYAEAVNQLLTINQISADNITAIGCHGQTIRHQPEQQFTLQIGNAALLAELTNITVVADFRSRDIAAGGQGAPLVPAFHQAVFASSHENRALINIGGIANITYLAKTSETVANSCEVLGFDSGPGNMLLDAWIMRHKDLAFDADGAWAASGQVISPLLTAMLDEPYFAISPPKSTGRDLFNESWLDQKLFGQNYRAQDIARTLVELTAQTIQHALLEYCSMPDSVYLCGGGSRNSLLKDCLQALLTHTKVETTAALGVGVDWVEAIAFAWLAKQCLQQKPANLPQVTGAKSTRILGAIYQR